MPADLVSSGVQGDQLSDPAWAPLLARSGLDWLDPAALGAVAGWIDFPRTTFRVLVASISLRRALPGIDFAVHGQCFH